MKAKRWILVAALVAVAAVAAAARPHALVVLRPGGPADTDQAKQQVDGLAKALAGPAGWAADSVSARYFNRLEPALAYIEAEKPGFVLGTPGFYLAYREKFHLKPVNQVELAEGTTSRFYVVVKDAAIKTLADLKGKLLIGAHLAEPDYVEKVLLAGALRFGTDVRVEAVSGLTALRRLDADEADAVILDDKEYRSLSALPFGGQLMTIFTSRPIPNTGIMAIGDNATAADIAALRQASAGFCASAAGRPVCDTFGIRGFAPVTGETYADLLQLAK